MDLEDCLRLLQDFDLLRDDCFLRSQVRTYFRHVKLWEYTSYSELALMGADLRFNLDVGADFHLAAGNLGLSLSGLLELLSRLATVNDIGDTPLGAVQALLHRMDLSSGKANLVGHSRKSMYKYIDSFQY